MNGPTSDNESQDYNKCTESQENSIWLNQVNVSNYSFDNVGSNINISLDKNIKNNKYQSNKNMSMKTILKKK